MPASIKSSSPKRRRIVKPGFKTVQLEEEVHNMVGRVIDVTGQSFQFFITSAVRKAALEEEARLRALGHKLAA